ncbi:histidine kinase dimerization/phospho-acceptor domain-containing protein [Sphingomonas sp.]|uniref:histidine kinase dimerization/phospho-acceptor domain-containing protein n=1 Tax=Sphingomonas sp. TaxID=28214 RepID=UPI0025E8B2A7|nr:histidine kinase dimerization/phospho-acceptor domain-containing protein [Sphingomonas sp.]
MNLRFDDTLETVLAADLSTPQGVQSAWRQLVDLVGRRRVPPDTRTMATLKALRPEVPVAVRAASARALEFGNPPAPLVRLLALDDLEIALPVLRSARLSSAEWVQLIPDLSPAGRSVLRNRRDLSPVVGRALESYGPADFVLPDASEKLEAPEVPLVAVEPATTPVAPEALSEPLDWHGALDDVAAPAAQPVEMPTSLSPNEDFLFAAVDDDSDALPPAEPGAFFGAAGVHAPPVAELPPEPTPAIDVGKAGAPVAATPAHGVPQGPEGTFEISEVMARIDAFWRNRETDAAAPRGPLVAEELRFETDAKGVIRWVEGANRAALVGLGLDTQGMPEGSRIDASAAGAFRHRAGFSNARMVIEGESDAAGDWLISAVPVFDSVNGRFAGYRGTGRRPRADERAERAPAPQPASADSLRQLVHELRTPTNAIAGFAEMIDAQMLGPVPDVYRERAQVIREQARVLLGAIDDLDLAARIDSAALALVPGPVPLRPLFAAIADELSPLAALRGALIALPIDDFAVIGDKRAVERLLSRLMATLLSASAAGERVGVRTALEGETVAIAIDRPRALAEYPGDSVLGIDDEREDTSLLGTGFALRLARNLARELGGSLVIEPESLTLRLPASVAFHMGQAHLS